MMRLVSGSFIGFMISILGSMLINVAMRFWAIASPELMNWLFFVSSPYFVIGYALLCYFFYNKKLSKPQYFNAIYLYPTLILLISCSFGTTIYEWTERELQSINVSGYFVSGIFYGLVLSPILYAINYVLYKRVFKIRLQVRS